MSRDKKKAPLASLAKKGEISLSGRKDTGVEGRITI